MRPDASGCVGILKLALMDASSALMDASSALMVASLVASSAQIAASLKTETTSECNNQDNNAMKYGKNTNDNVLESNIEIGQFRTMYSFSR